MGNPPPFSRRQFLHLSGAGLGALLLPRRWLGLGASPLAWPRLRLEQLPPRVLEVLSQVPRTWVSPDGFLHLAGPDGRDLGPVAQSYTQWNREHSHAYERLRTEIPWAIVLHWFGDREGFPGTLRAYLRGFDSLREIDGVEVRTSAHFLVGPERPGVRAAPDGPVGIIQTQAPAPDGVPYLASHLQPIDLAAHAARRQYFVRALYQLGFADPGLLGDREQSGMISLLQDFFDGRYQDQNKRTLAVEITGYDFEDPAHAPPPRQVANVVSLVWALMKRYRVRAADLLGHHEVQLNKSDPGKKFMALIRQLIGLKALVEDDEGMRRLVFGQFIGPGEAAAAGVSRYFKFVRDYLVLTGVPRSVYEWEAACNYWHCQGLLTGSPASFLAGGGRTSPLGGEVHSPGRVFLDPEDHEGIDLYQDGYRSKAFTSRGQPVRLVSPGVCLYAGEAFTCAHGAAAIFQHYLPDGSQVLSVYGHLGQLGDLRVGGIYPHGHGVGETMGSVPQEGRFLHFALAYGATWDVHLSKHTTLPQNAGPTWIQEHYLPPLEYLGGGAFIPARPADRR